MFGSLCLELYAVVDYGSYIVYALLELSVKDIGELLVYLAVSVVSARSRLAYAQYTSARLRISSENSVTPFDICV